MVRLPFPHLPHHQVQRHRARRTASGNGPAHLRAYRSKHLLHVHDHRRGRREEGDIQKVPGCVSARPEGELHGLAGGSDLEFSDRADSVSDSVREYGGDCLDGLLESDKFGRRGMT